MIYGQTALGELHVAVQYKHAKHFIQQLLDVSILPLPFLVVLTSSSQTYKKDYNFYIDDMLERMEHKISTICGFLGEALRQTREDRPDYSETFQAVSEYNNLNDRLQQLQHFQRASKKAKK